MYVHTPVHLATCIRLLAIHIRLQPPIPGCINSYLAVALVRVCDLTELWLPEQACCHQYIQACGHEYGPTANCTKLWPCEWSSGNPYRDVAVYTGRGHQYRIPAVCTGLRLIVQVCALPYGPTSIGRCLQQFAQGCAIHAGLWLFVQASSCPYLLSCAHTIRTATELQLSILVCGHLYETTAICTDLLPSLHDCGNLSRTTANHRAVLILTGLLLSVHYCCCNLYWAAANSSLWPSVRGCTLPYRNMVICTFLCHVYRAANPNPNPTHVQFSAVYVPSW